MVEMLVVAICYLDGREYCVAYVILEIQQLLLKQQIYVMIVGIDFNEKEYSKKDMGMVYAFSGHRGAKVPRL